MSLQQQLEQILESQQRQQKEIELLQVENKGLKRRLKCLTEGFSYSGQIKSGLRELFLKMSCQDSWLDMTGSFRICQDPFLNLVVNYLDEFEGAILTRVCKWLWFPKKNRSLIEGTSSHTNRLPNSIVCLGDDSKKFKIFGVYYKTKSKVLSYVDPNDGTKVYSPEEVIYIHYKNPHLLIQFINGVWTFLDTLKSNSINEMKGIKLIVKTGSLLGDIHSFVAFNYDRFQQTSPIRAGLYKFENPISFGAPISGDFSPIPNKKEFYGYESSKRIHFLDDKWRYVDYKTGEILESIQTSQDLSRVTHWRAPTDNLIIKILSSAKTRLQIDMGSTQLDKPKYHFFPSVKEKYSTFMRISGILGPNKECNGVYKLDSDFRNGRPQYSNLKNLINMHFYPNSTNWIFEDIKQFGRIIKPELYGLSKCLTPRRSPLLPLSGIWYASKTRFGENILKVNPNNMIRCQVTVEYSDNSEFI